MTDELDRAIDRAAREMLDVEPRADLRARVLSRLRDHGSRLPTAGFTLPAFGLRMLATVATAAVVLLLVLLARSGAPVMPQPPVMARGGDQHLPAEMTAVKGVASVPAAAPAERGGGVRRVAARPPARVVAAAVDEDRNFSAIAALAGPPAIDVAGLEAPAAGALPSFAPEPMSIRALDVSALPETPRERREE